MTAAYTSNGRVASVTDAENNKTSYVYDGFDRLIQTQYPSSTKGAGTSNSADYEQLSYDANGNITSRRLRDGNSIGFTFDALNRVTAKNLPGSEPDVSYSYDVLGHLTQAATSSHTLSFTYDALGRNLTQVSPHGTVTSTYDLAGRRTRIAHPDGFYVDQDYLVTGELQKIRENGATSGVGVLATYTYDDLGRRTSLTFGNGNSTSYSFDAVSRLSSLSHDMSGTSSDQTLSFAYNPASEITSNSRSNNAFAWLGHGSGTTSSTANGLNQLSAIGGTGTSHDSRGNMTGDGLGHTFGYSSENLLTSGPGSTALSYDPAMRLYQVAGASTTRFQYDGTDAIAEYNGSNSLQRRFVHGPGTDEPIVWYEGSGTTDRRFLQADERGSVVAVSNSSGTVTNVNTYDEYGKPGSGNVGRFQYTGQKWIPEIGLYDYKARMYHPGLLRFMQTDPIGFNGGMNLYAYVGANPVNRADPSGRCSMQTWVMHIYDGRGNDLGPDLVNPESGVIFSGCDFASAKTSRALFRGAGGSSNPLNWPHGEKPVEEEDLCRTAINAIDMATAVRLGTGFDRETIKVLEALASGGSSSFSITSTGMAQLQQTINERREGLSFISEVGSGISHYTFNFALGIDSQYTFGYSSPTALGALLGRANVYMRGDTLIGVSDRFDYVGSYEEADIRSGVEWANSMLNRNCPNRQQSIPITGGSVP